MNIIEARANNVSAFINLDTVSRMSVAKPTEDQIKQGLYTKADRLIKVVFNNGEKGEYVMNRAFHKALSGQAYKFRKGLNNVVEVVDEAATE